MAERNITISGKEFVIPQPFEAGHVCTDGEARALNQTYSEAIRNNMAKKVKDGNADQAAVSEYAGQFVFTVASAAASAKFTPEEREARSIARDAIKTKLAGEGKKLTDVDADKLEAAIAQVAARPDIVKRATKIVADRKKEVVDITDLDLGTAPEEAEAETETEAGTADSGDTASDEVQQ